ncbi:hypothetical protein PACTADRAFT_41896 [Pachysolen tannophilus NRRL Y-2460]|uniref:Ribose-5-phosphate isomerase n=1 Tax=Pachysolen tannophilus NRRL Y-2460 TaxID=669874 RepID=A0A1E4TWC9_PACTA|nr:hypothetical protein PACTADRAFT_41896 [Pachysolen tannophilus NRRL Y-2460]
MTSLVEQSKKSAAYQAVDDNLKPSYKIIGIGSGSTVVYVAERIGQLSNKSQFTCIPTGFQSKQLILSNGLKLGSIEEFPNIDITFDGADEIDSDLNVIKGGGACLMQEKLVASCSKKFIIVADFRKKSPTGQLGVNWRKGVPIEIIPASYTKILKELKEFGAVKAEVRSGGSAKAGPVITDNGMFIIDADFGAIPPAEVSKLHNKIKFLTGVVDVGLFVNMVEKTYIGEENGSVSTMGN